MNDVIEMKVECDNDALDRADEVLEAQIEEMKDAKQGDVKADSLHVNVASFIRKEAKLFHDAEDNGYAQYGRADHTETHPLESMAFRKYASWIAFTHFQQALGRDAMASLVALLSSHASFDGEQRRVERRVAHRSGVYYIDLCNAEWQVVEVRPGIGWEILDSDKNPIKFIRSRNAQALPIPEHGATIEVLWEYINIPEGDRMRVLTWILETFRPETQYPILSLKAVAGSGKTETVNTLRLLIDPNKALTSRLPNSTRDVLSNAQNNHVIAFDNLSYISDSLSDLLCCMATGTGHRERRLYTNLEEEVLELKRPVMFDGIEFLARRDDLVDRLIHVELPPFSEGSKINEREFRRQRKQDLPLIFGAILDLFQRATYVAEKLSAGDGVRMMDYGRLGQAVHRVLGVNDDFTAELREHQSTLKHRVLDDSPFLGVVLDRLSNAYQVDGNALQGAEAWFGVRPTICVDGSMRFQQYPGKLLEHMESMAKEFSYRTTDWPRKANGVMGVFDRNKTALENLGFSYRKDGHDERGTLYTFTYHPEK